MNFSTKHLLPLFLLFLSPARGELPPSAPPVGSSSNGRYLAISEDKLRLYSRTDDGMQYRLVGEIEPLGFASKMLISDDGGLIVTFERPEMLDAPELDSLICLYERNGKRLKVWKLREVLETRDAARLAPHTSISVWAHNEALLTPDAKEVWLAGPFDIDGDRSRYLYVLDLEKQIWRKGEQR
jgi:hypothetical protein